MKVELYNQIVRSGMTRRGVLKGAAATGGLAALGGLVPGMAAADAHGDVRAAILAIPGVGAGSPTGRRLARCAWGRPRPMWPRANLPGLS
jgi:multiple sugar transport system substrate-binding protein